MTRERAGSAAWVVTGILMATLAAGCGGDPEPKGDPTAGSSSPSGPGSSSAGTPASTFPPDVPLADGPWIPSPSLKIKVPQGFKGEADFGVTALRKGDLVITIYDPGTVGDTQLDGAIKTEKRLNFTGSTKVESGSATVDGQDVQTFVMTGDYEFFKRVSYGFGVDDTDGETRFVVIGFEGEKDPTTQQDTIDAVLSSITWSPTIVG